MQRWISWVSRIVILALVLGSVGPADAKRKRKRKPKTDAEEQMELLAAESAEAPGWWRWYQAMTFSKAQIKVNRIDTSQSPMLKLHMSILTVDPGGLLLPVTDPTKLRQLELLVATGDEKRPQPLVKLVEGNQEPTHDDIAAMPEEERPPLATLQSMADEGVPLDVVVVAAGHAGFRDVERLQNAHKSAVSEALSKLGDARVNVIRYGPMLYTYRSFEGMERVMSRFDESLMECERERNKLRVAAARQAASDEEGPKLPDPPCGLQSGKTGDMNSALGKLPFRGQHARLFGIDRSGINPCSEQVYSSTALRHIDLDALEQRTFDAGAFEEALRMLVRYGRPGSRKAIIVMGTGRDGFLQDDVVCRRLFTSSNKFCASIAGKLRGRKGREAIQACAQKKLDERSTVLQERWSERAVEWLALLRAAEIKVYAVAYNFNKEDGNPVSYAWERERLELLAHKSGGTYREVTQTKDVGDAALATADEIKNEWVLSLAGFLESEMPYKVVVKAKVDIGAELARLKSLTEYEFVAPFRGEGFWYWVGTKSDWLKMKVGVVLYWVIVVVAILLLLLVLWLLFKLMKALVMKIVKLVAKKGTAAAKSAAKGAG